MKLFSFFSCAALVFAGAAFSPAHAQDGAELDKEAAGYAIGQQFGGILKDAQDAFDMDALIQGLNDALADKEPMFTQEELQSAFMQFQQVAAEAAQKAAAERAAMAKEEGLKFLETNSKRDDITVLPSGLQYEVVKSGDGATPTDADTVVAHYRGTFIDGEEFDSSFARGEPAEFPVTRVIPGWTEALKLMKVGDVWKLYIPSDLAYGEGGNQRIPGGSVLLFDIELIGIK